MDHYQTLGVSRKASQEEIQSAYHEFALKFHPDANPDNPDAAEKFKTINKAYQVLRKPTSRKEYDLTLGGGGATKAGPGATRTNGSSAGSPSPGRPGTAAGGVPGGMSGNPLADMLNDLRGGNAGGAKTAAPASDEKSNVPTVEIKLTTREAVSGAVRTILVNGRPLRIRVTIQR